MKTLASVLVLLALAGCTSVQQSTRISTDLAAAEFNSLASRYMTRPTFISVESMSDGATVLLVRMDTYGRDPMMPNGSEIRFSKEHVSEYVQAIDKFLEWSSLAKERRDAFTKEIGTAPTWGNMAKGALRFQFHSGNAQQHYLIVAFSAAGTTLEQFAQFYDEPQARKLKELLLSFGSGGLAKTSIEAVYK